jgi:hypothetical protein
MPRVPDNPDQDFSADEIDNLSVETLRSLLERSDAADLFDAATRERIGQAIARAATMPPPQQSRVPRQQQQQQQCAADNESDQKD